MLLRFAPARGASRHALRLVLWALPCACATYDNSLLGTSGGAGRGGTSSGGTSSGGTSSGGTGGMAQGGMVQAGAGKSGAGLGGNEGDAGAADNAAGMGGDAAAGGETSAGAAGRAGAAGNSGSGGRGGTPSGGAGGTGGAGGKASGGNGGSSGSVATQTCSKNPIPVKTAWTVTASSSRAADPVSNAYDGVLTNRWSTAKDQAADWLQVDFGVATTLTKLTLMLGNNPDDYPRSYSTRVSNTSMNQAAPVLASGMGAAGVDTVMSFPAGTTGRYVLISQSGAATGKWWSVAELVAECAD